VCHPRQETKNKNPKCHGVLSPIQFFLALGHNDDCLKFDYLYIYMRLAYHAYAICAVDMQNEVKKKENQILPNKRSRHHNQ
jgi:hypothetical protein